MSDTVATSTGVVAASRDTDTRSSPGSAAKPAVGRGSTCSGCGRAISDRFLLYAMDRHWHVGCLRCSVCQMPLDDAVATCYTRAGLILCRTDYLRSVRPLGRITVTCVNIWDSFTPVKNSRGYVISGVYLFILTDFFISSITQKVTGGFGWNFQGRLDLVQSHLRGDKIISIQDRIRGFFTIAI